MLAKKRMIDCTTVASSDFDDLSFMAQALYCRLVADTDDMGVAEAGAVIRNASRMRKSALKELVDNGFVTIIRDKGNIVYINGFHDNNSFANHGARKSRYMTELLQHDCTKNVINTVKIKDLGYPRLGDAMNGEAMTGEVEICNAQKYLAVIEDMGLRQTYPDLAESLYEWYQYTDESGISKATDVSINKMIEQAVKRCDNTSEEDVCNYIDKAIANAYKSINWSWFDDMPFK